STPLDVVLMCRSNIATAGIRIYMRSSGHARAPEASRRSTVAEPWNSKRRTPPEGDPTGATRLMVGKMPNLPRPRLRRTRSGELVAPLPPEPQTPHVEEIAAEGLRWVKIDRPGPLEQTWLEENFDFHALDYEDVVSRNQRPKIDVYDDYLFIVLQFP